MSLVVSTPGQICNSPLNNSKSKMLFSFPKSKKISEIRKSDCLVAFYDLPPARESRAPSFGFGNKYDFSKDSHGTPAPTAYDIKSMFSRGHKRGYSMGLGREIMAATGAQFVGERSSPGPAAYDIRESNKPKISYTFRPRVTQDLNPTQKIVPGPGTYQTVDDINPKGKYSTSKFKNSGATVVAPAHSNRWALQKDRSAEPGPGTYDLKVNLNPSGSYFVSKFKNSVGRSFGNSQRSGSVPNLNTPGPGTYRLPSEFGYYEQVSKTSREKSPEGEKKSGQHTER